MPREVRTERLLLRQWTREDVAPLAQIYTQPEFLAHMRGLDFYQTREQVSRFIRAWREDGFSQWAAVELASGRLIGRVGLVRHHDWPLGAEPVEAGWVLHRDYWGRGLATEGGAASVRCWRDRLPDEARLLSVTRPGNARSRAVMERLGFSRRGTTFWAGSDVVWYAMDR